VLLRLAYLGVTNALALLRLLPMSDRDKDAEILALRHQIMVLERQLRGDRVKFSPVDRAWLAALLHPLPRTMLNQLRLLVRPETVLRWHRNLIAPDTPDPTGSEDRRRSGRSGCWCCAWLGRSLLADPLACHRGLQPQRRPTPCRYTVRAAATGPTPSRLRLDTRAKITVRTFVSVRCPDHPEWTSNDRDTQGRNHRPKAGHIMERNTWSTPPSGSPALTRRPGTALPRRSEGRGRSTTTRQTVRAFGQKCVSR
jgi:hypothetical protein